MPRREIGRDRYLARLQNRLRRFPVVVLIGARQVGKTTLAHQLISRKGPAVTYFDLENTADLARLADPLLTFESLRGLVVLDEAQHLPELFSTLRILVDRSPRPARFLLLGSASPDLLRHSAEWLAPNIVYEELGGLMLEEVGVTSLDRLWVRGGFPASFLARTDADSAEWRRAFLRTFLERSFAQLGITIPSITLLRFWTMLAHYHGQVWNASEFARSFGVGDHTVRRYLDVLTGAFVIRTLQPWSENLGKRQVKAPKVYVADSGLLHTLLGLHTLRDLESHPKLGASWEGFVIDAIVRHLGARREECFYWATYAGAELDLLIVRGRQRLGFECKRTVAPRVTPSMRTALADLRLQRLDVVHAGRDTYPLAPGIRAVAMARLLADLKPMTP